MTGPREIGDTLEPASPADTPAGSMEAAPFPNAKRGPSSQHDEPTETSPLLARPVTPPFRETPKEQRRGLWPIRLSFFFATLLLFISSGAFVLIAFSSVHPAVAAVLPVHRGSTLLPAWLALISIALTLLNMLYFAQPRWSPIRAAMLFNVLILVMALIQIGFVAIDPDNRTREAVLTLVMEAVLLVTAAHSLLATKVLPPTAMEAYEARRHRSWLRTTFAVAGVTLPLFIFHVTLFLAVLGLTFDLAVRTHDASLEPPGVLVDVKPRAVASGRGLFDRGASLGTYKYRVHLHCQGGTREGDDSGLTVLMESQRGYPGSVEGQWAVEALANQSTIRLCRWDRPGYGFSDNAPSSELPYVAQALHDAMHSAGELQRMRANRGLVLIGSGYGGLLVRVFADMHRDDIHSILFEDALTELTTFPGPALGFTRFFRTVVPDLSAPLGIRPLISILLYPGQASREARKLSSARLGLSTTMPRSRLQEYRALQFADSPSARSLRLAKRHGPPARRATVISSAWRTADETSVWAEAQGYLAHSIIGEQNLVRWSHVGPKKRPRHGDDRRRPVCESTEARAECAKALFELMNG